MVKKLLLGLGVVTLAAVGSVAAWRLVDDSGREGALTLSTTPQLTIPSKTAPSMRSPNGDYSVVVGNSGITLSGPSGSIEIDGGGVLVKSSSNTVEITPGAIDISSAASATFRGAVVRLGCASGGQGVVRNGQVPVQGQVTVGSNGGTFPIQGSALLLGSPTVLAC